VAFHESYWSALTRRESQSLSTQPAIRERENGALLDSQHPGRDSGGEIFTLLVVIISPFPCWCCPPISSTTWLCCLCLLFRD
jgi:hypothetical protein